MNDKPLIEWGVNRTPITELHTIDDPHYFGWLERFEKDAVAIQRLYIRELISYSEFTHLQKKLELKLKHILKL